MDIKGIMEKAAERIGKPEFLADRAGIYYAVIVVAMDLEGIAGGVLGPGEVESIETLNEVVESLRCYGEADIAVKWVEWEPPPAPPPARKKGKR